MPHSSQVDAPELGLRDGGTTLKARIWLCGWSNGRADRPAVFSKDEDVSDVVPGAQAGRCVGPQLRRLAWMHVPALPADGRSRRCHSPKDHAVGGSRGSGGASPRVMELWSEPRPAWARNDVGYVFVFENNGRAIGATIDHPHSQILASASFPRHPGRARRVDCELAACPMPR